MYLWIPGKGHLYTFYISVIYSIHVIESIYLKQNVSIRNDKTSLWLYKRQKKAKTVCTSKINQPADSCGRHLPLSGSLTQLSKKTLK